jgi:hypothetical protein
MQNRIKIADATAPKIVHDPDRIINIPRQQKVRNAFQLTSRLFPCALVVIDANHREWIAVKNPASGRGVADRFVRHSKKGAVTTAGVHQISWLMLERRSFE